MISRLKKWWHAVFSEFIEDPDYPFARIYRESVWVGIEDTYDILAGDRSDGTEDAGILDLFVFPVIGRKAQNYADRNTNEWAGGFALFIGALFGAATRLLGILLTLALVPIIMIVHGLAYFKAKPLRKAVAKLQVRDLTKEDIAQVALDTKVKAYNVEELLRRIREKFKKAGVKECYKQRYNLLLMSIPQKEDTTQVSFSAKLRSIAIQNGNVPILFYRNSQMHLFGCVSATKWRLTELEFSVCNQYIAAFIPKAKRFPYLLKKEAVNEAIYQHIASRNAHFLFSQSKRLDRWIEEENQFIRISNRWERIIGSDFMIRGIEKSTPFSEEKNSATKESKAFSVGLVENSYFSREDLPYAIIDENAIGNLSVLKAMQQLGLVFLHKSHLVASQDEIAVLKKQKEAFNYLLEELRSKNNRRSYFFLCVKKYNKQAKTYDFCLMEDRQEEDEAVKSTTIYIKRLNDSLLKYAVRGIDDKKIHRGEISATQLERKAFPDPMPVSLKDEIRFFLSKKRFTQGKIPLERLPSLVTQNIFAYLSP